MSVTRLGGVTSTLFGTVGNRLGNVGDSGAASVAGGGGTSTSDGICTAGSKAYATPGTVASFSLAADGDADCTTVQVSLWGGGGGFGAIYFGYLSSGRAGAGGYTTALLDPSLRMAALTVQVGGGGPQSVDTANSVTDAGGAGGGASAVLSGSTVIAVAAGGGGGGTTIGGGGGGTTSGSGVSAGQSGESSSYGGGGGIGGGPSGPGAAGVGDRRNGQAGSGQNGGQGSDPSNLYNRAATPGYGTGGAGYGMRVGTAGGEDTGGGGGGGGYHGGGGGGGAAGGAGGGGGSSYRHPTLTASGQMTRGTGHAPAGTADPGYLSPAGVGGNEITPQYNGGAGRVVFRWQ